MSDPVIVVEFELTEELAKAGGSFYDAHDNSIHVLEAHLLYALAVEHEQEHFRQFKRFGGLGLVFFPSLMERRAWSAAYQRLTR